MRKIIFITTITILTILVSSIIYLSTYGIKTDSFNKLIDKKVKEFNPKLTVQLEDVFIKLNLRSASININTQEARFIVESSYLKIDNIDINLDIAKFIQKENSIKKINIRSKDILVKDITSFLNIINYDLSRYILYSQIKGGLIKFELETQFDENIQKINSFNIAGSVKNAKFNLIGYDNLENINFDFVAKNNIIKISDLNFNYQNIKLISESIEAITEKPNTYFIRGDIKNNETSLDPNLILKIFNINQDFISEKNKILISSKNFFSFELNKKNKVEDVKIDSFINFNEIHFKNKYQNIIFLKNGKINLKYENGKLNGDLDSNFAFNNNLNVKDRNKNNIVKLSLSKENNSNIKIKGNITNEKTLLNSKILLNLANLIIY